MRNLIVYTHVSLFVFVSTILLLPTKASFASSVPIDEKVILWQSSENPNGLQFGFWPNFQRQPEVLNDYGQRPLVRSEFRKWNQIEVSPGLYDWNGVFDKYKLGHLNGSTVIGCVNIALGNAINPNKSYIPSFYADSNGTTDINDPVTRAAALDFLEAYVEEMLNEVGTMILLLDYEPMSNYRLWNATNQATFRDWFIEAANAAKSKAASMGMANNLKIGINVNGNLLSEEKQEAYFGLSNGVLTNKQWLIDCVNAADVFTVDTYYVSDGSTAPNDTSATPYYVRDTLLFWRDNFAQGKPFIVAEHGFSSTLTTDPNYNNPGLKMGHGTELDQKEHFATLLPLLEGLNINGFCMWAYADRNTGNAFQDSFGTIRIDNTEKPVFATVKNWVTALDAGVTTSPWFKSWGGNVTNATSSLGNGAVAMTYEGGTDHHWLKYSGTIPTSATSVTLHIDADKDTAVLLKINDVWMELTENLSSFYDLDITPWVTLGQRNFIEIRFTNEKFPFSVNIDRLTVTYD